MKKKDRKIFLAGGLIIGLAVLIVLLSIFVPRLVHRSQMKEIFEQMLSPDAAYLAVGDPLYATGDLLGNNGKEVLLEGAALEEVRTALAALAESGYRTDGEEKKATGAWDLNLKVRTPEEETLRLFLTEENFYYVEGEVAFFFEPKDDEAYSVLREKLLELLEAQ